MAALKAFLAAHGEKLVLAVVALLTLFSLYSNFTEESSGVSPAEIQDDLDRIRKHAKQKTAQSDAKAIPQSHRIVQAILEVYQEDTWQAQGWDGALYAMPPLPSTAKPPVPPSDCVPPPPFHTQIDMPIDVHAKVGGRRIVIVWREGLRTRWRITPRAAIWRKVVGDGAKDANPDRVYRLQRRRVGEPVDSGGGETGRGGDSEVANMFDRTGMGTGADDRRADDPAAADPNQDPEATAPLLAEGEVQTESIDAKVDAERLARQEAAAERDLKLLVDPTGYINSSWRLLGKDLVPLEEEPKIEVLLSGEAPVYDDSEPELTEENPAVTPRWFCYVDEDLNENTVYRYRVIVYGKTAPLPESVVRKCLEKDAKFKNYTPVVRAGRDQLALSAANRAEELMTQLERDRTTSKGAAAWQLEFQLLPYQPRKTYGEDFEGKTIPFWDWPLTMRPEERRLRAEHAGFGRFAYSDYVLTSVRTEVEYRSDYPGDQIAVEVTIRTDENEKVKKNFRVKRPQIPAGVHEKFLDVTRQASFRELYGKVNPTPIGGEDSVGNITHDFSSSWGLVDIRDCRIVTRTYRVEQKTDSREGPVVDENKNPVLVREYSPGFESDHKYMVLRELEGRQGQKPRFKVKLKYKHVRNPFLSEGGAKVGDRGSEVEVKDWNPGIEKPAAAQDGPNKKRAASAPESE